MRKDSAGVKAAKQRIDADRDKPRCEAMAGLYQCGRAAGHEHGPEPQHEARRLDGGILAWVGDRW